MWQSRKQRGACARSSCPSEIREVPRGDERIAAIVALAEHDDAATGCRKKLPHDARDARAGFLHQRVGGDAVFWRGHRFVDRIEREERSGPGARGVAPFTMRRIVGAGSFARGRLRRMSTSLKTGPA